MTDRKELAKLLPSALSMAEIVRPIEVWAVRMKRFNRKENTVFGAMVWPEVLVCENRTVADILLKFLDNASFQEYMETVRESDPEAEPQNHKQKWSETDLMQYMIEHVPDLTKYPELERVGESMSVMKRLFPTLDGIAALKRRK